MNPIQAVTVLNRGQSYRVLFGESLPASLIQLLMGLSSGWDSSFIYAQLVRW